MKEEGLHYFILFAKSFNLGFLLLVIVLFFRVKVLINNVYRIFFVFFNVFFQNNSCCDFINNSKNRCCYLNMCSGFLLYGMSLQTYYHNNERFENLKDFKN